MLHCSGILASISISLPPLKPSLLFLTGKEPPSSKNVFLSSGKVGITFSSHYAAFNYITSTEISNFVSFIRALLIRAGIPIQAPQRTMQFKDPQSKSKHHLAAPL